MRRAEDVLVRIQAANIAAGKCPNCGGSGVVADMAGIERTGDPHRNRRCGTCRGSGALRTRETP